MATRSTERHRWDIGDVLDRTDLSALLDELTESSGRSGPGRKWHCPTPGHDDRHPSVSMFRDHSGHERWRCWSGEHRGDAIDLVSAATGRNNADAIEWLANRAGMVPDRPLPPIPRKPSPVAGTARVMDPAVARYVYACARVLSTSAGEPVRAWLHSRGIEDATISANLIGADPGRRMLHRQRGLPFGSTPAATFPVYGPAGDLTYVQARYLDAEASGRKYDNPSAALAPHPRLGFTVAPHLVHHDTLVVCEGMPDALIAAQGGFQAVGLLGAQTPDESVAARLTNHAENLDARIVLVCDPDPAGRRVAELLAPLLEGRGHDPAVVTSPEGRDLNDWALTDPHWSDQLTERADALGVKCSAPSPVSADVDF
jgi:DNA primase